MLPILFNHDVTNQIGACEITDDGVILTFNKHFYITASQLIDLFPAVAFEIIKMKEKNGDEIYVEKARLVYFSI